MKAVVMEFLALVRAVGFFGKVGPALGAPCAATSPSPSSPSFAFLSARAAQPLHIATPFSYVPPLTPPSPPRPACTLIPSYFPHFSLDRNGRGSLGRTPPARGATPSLPAGPSSLSPCPAGSTPPSSTPVRDLPLHPLADFSQNLSCAVRKGRKNRFPDVTTRFI